MAKYSISEFRIQDVVLKDLELKIPLNSPREGYSFHLGPLNIYGYSKESEWLAIEDLKCDAWNLLMEYKRRNLLEKHLTKCGFKQNEDGSWKYNNN